MELRSGIRVDRYVLLDPLGKGAQGAVWRVRDPLDGTEKALKLFDLKALSKQGAERARREAQAVTKLKHPAIVACHTLFELPAEDRLGLVFDLVRGEPLADVVHDGRMTPLHRDALLVQLAAALEHVHARGIVHRDLKPANILLADTFWGAPRALGGVKLVDFGIAAAVGNPQGVTAPGALIGTRPYLAPDLLLPGRWGPPSDDFARDVFAFGVLAWELLVGGHPTGLPFVAPLEKYAAAYRDAADGLRPWPPVGLASPTAWVIGACLALHPARRPTDGAALSAALQVGAMPSGRAPSSPALAAPTEAKDTQTEMGVGRRAFTALSGARASLSTPMPMVDTTSIQSSAIRSPRAPRPRRSAAAWIAAGVVVAVLVAGAVSYVVATVMLASRPPDPLPPSPATGAGPAPDVDPPAPVPCCGDGTTCKSGRSCNPGTCTAILPDRWWYLRVTGVALRSIEQGQTGASDSFPEDMAGTHPRGRVCLARSASPGTEACVPIAKAARTKDGDRSNRLRVRTSDLESGGLEIRVEDGGVELARGPSAPNERGLSTTVLCRGMSLYVGPRATALARVFAYLDDG